jgi:hypothetical protein
LNDGAIGGAGNIASGQVLYGTAAGVAGSEAAFVYDATINQATIGGVRTGDTAAYSGYAAWGHSSQYTAAGLALIQGSAGDTYLNSGAAASLVFRIGAVESFRVAPTTRNLLVGTTTDDGTNRLQVAGSVAVSKATNPTQTFTDTTAYSGVGATGSVFGTIAMVGTLNAATATNNIKSVVNNANGVSRADIAFETSDGAGSNFEKFRMQWDGQFRVYNTATAGSSALFVREGATQSTAEVVGIYATDGTTARLSIVSGNTIVGGNTNNNFRLDIASSGSSGTLRAYDQTPTTGVTQVIVRAGAGQSTTNLTTWQNSSGTTAAYVESSGRINSQVGFFVNASGGAVLSPFASTLGAFSRGFAVGWSDASDAAFHASGYLFRGTTATNTDLSLSRAGVNIGQFGDGGSNSNGLLYLKGVRPVGSTVANLPAAGGNTGMMATVTDATVTTIGTTVAGGGANTVLVWSNGTNWRIYAN